MKTHVAKELPKWRPLLIFTVVLILVLLYAIRALDCKKDNTQGQSATADSARTRYSNTTLIEEVNLSDAMKSIKNESRKNGVQENAEVQFSFAKYDFDEKALFDLQQRAEHSDTEAQYRLGKFYYDNSEIEKAVDLFVRAANQGLPEAQYALGVCYMLNFFDEANDDYLEQMQSLEWLKKSAEQGYAPAQFYLGYWGKTYFKQNDVNEIELFGNAAEQGYAPAQFWLSVYYENGVGIETDSIKSAELRNKALKQITEQVDAINDQHKLYQLRR